MIPAAAPRQVSVLVPALNEAGTLEELVGGTRAAMASVGVPSYEIILIATVVPKMPLPAPFPPEHDDLS